MKKELNLGGIWQVKGYGPNGEKMSLPAKVPGMIHLDLEREGKIPTMFWRDNAEQCQWVETWTWEYSTYFDVPADADLSYAVLEFGGLDTYADIWLNGRRLAKTQNAQIPHEFFVKDYINHGKNRIKITFTPYQQHIQGKRMDYVAAFNRSDRVHVRRMQCTFYWDWVGRFVTFGPWRPIILHFYDEARIRSQFVWTHDIAQTSASLQMQVETEIRKDLEGMYQIPAGSEIPPETARFGDINNGQMVFAPRPTYIPTAKIEIIDPDGRVVWKERRVINNPRIYIQADIKDPKLWWPVNYGDQPLYSLHIVLFGKDGRPVDEKTTRFGIRTVRVEQVKDAPGSKEEKMTDAVRKASPEPRNYDLELEGSSFTLLVNGVRIMCKGGNWVPADPFPCRITKEKYERLVKLAAVANLNLLRVWGGGIYESDDFLEACDKFGVMLTYDFQLACARFPEDDEEWVENYKDEVPKAIRRLRNHPSIVWYAGDNENACHFDYDDPGAPGTRLLREVYYKDLSILDPSRNFFPSSPFYGHNNCSTTMGDCHQSWYYEKKDMPRRLLKATPRFASECCTQGSSMFATLRTFMTDEDMADPEVKIFDYHVKDNPHKPAGTPTLYVQSREVSDNLLGKPANTEQKILKDAYTQYIWCDETIQAFRRNKWYSSGIQFWMYNDCWPTTGLALVDYYLVPKAGYYGAMHASRPVMVTFRELDDGVDVMVCNDSLSNSCGNIRVYVQENDGGKREVYSGRFFSKANENCDVTTIKFSDLPVKLGKGNQLIAEISGPCGFHRSFYASVWPKDMEFPKAEVVFSIDKETSTVTVSSEKYARAVAFDIIGFCEDNFFDLLPGETRVIKVTPYEGHTLDELAVYWLNR